MARSIEKSYLLNFYEKFGLKGAIAIISMIAFAFGMLIILPVNFMIGGSVVTGLVINLIICSTFIPYHLYRIISLLNRLNSMQEKLYELSIRDELTGAYNRRFIFESLNSITDSNSFVPENTSLIMLDIDNFKLINDTHGHHTGDEVLRALTINCASVLRASDIFARYGGDEFICLLPQTNADQAREIANRIKDKILKVKIRDKKDQLMIATSVGTATSTSKIGLMELISAADQALYRSKFQHKNLIGAINEKP